MNRGCPLEGFLFFLPGLCQICAWQANLLSDSLGWLPYMALYNAFSKIYQLFLKIKSLTNPLLAHNMRALWVF